MRADETRIHAVRVNELTADGRLLPALVQELETGWLAKHTPGRHDPIPAAYVAAACAQCDLPMLVHPATHAGAELDRPTQFQVLLQRCCSHDCAEVLSERLLLERKRELYALAHPPALPTPRPCALCGELFDAKRHDARYCSPRCRQAASRAGKEKPAQGGLWVG